MRTTLNIDDDVLREVKEIAEREGSPLGTVLSDLARRGFFAMYDEAVKSRHYRTGVPVIPSRGETITLEHIQTIMDAEGI